MLGKAGKSHFHNHKQEIIKGFSLELVRQIENFNHSVHCNEEYSTAKRATTSNVIAMRGAPSHVCTINKKWKIMKVIIHEKGQLKGKIYHTYSKNLKNCYPKIFKSFSIFQLHPSNIAI